LQTADFGQIFILENFAIFARIAKTYNYY